MATRTLDGKSGPVLSIRGPESVHALLIAVGAAESAHAWESGPGQQPRGNSISGQETLRESNLRKSRKAALSEAAHALHALSVLGDAAPPHLVEAGLLRAANADVSLDALGALMSPPLTKDAIAGRLRRLSELAAKAEGTATRTG